MNKDNNTGRNHAPDILKGVSIIAIALHHYIRRYFPDHFDLLGHQFVLIFFIVSGFLAQLSITKEDDSDSGYKQALTFYIKRLARLYPLYWLWLILTRTWGRSSYIDFDIVRDVFLLSYKDIPTQWFLVSLVHCYILAPAISRLSRKNYDLCISIIIFAILNIAMNILSIPKDRVTSFLDIYCSHIMAFCIGMHAYQCAPLSKLSTRKLTVLTLATLPCMLLAFNQKGDFRIEYITSEWLSGGAALVFAALFVNSFTALCSRISISVQWIEFLGKHSYPIYLFHGLYYFSMAKAGIAKDGNVTGLAITVALSPLFIYTCGIVDKLFSFFIASIIKQTRDKIAFLPNGVSQNNSRE